MSDMRMAGKPVSAKRGKIIAVASGKGGVGKTFISITLSHAFARRMGRHQALKQARQRLASVV